MAGKPHNEAANNGIVRDTHVSKCAPYPLCFQNFECFQDGFLSHWGIFARVVYPSMFMRVFAFLAGMFIFATLSNGMIFAVPERILKAGCS